MRRLEGALFHFTAAGMELSWLYPLVAVLFVAIEKAPFPFIQGVAAFLLGAAVTFLTAKKSWRLIYSALIQVIALAVILSRVFYVYGSWDSPFLSRVWLQELFQGPYAPLEGLSLLLLFFSCIGFYAAGICLARRPVSHSALCTRFDVGIAATFLALIIAGTSEVNYPQAQYYMFSFFLFSIMAVALAKNSNSSGENVYTYRGLGTTLTFVSVVLLVGSATFLLFLPQLIFAAETSYTMLSTAARPVVPLLVNILLFMFGRGGARVEEQPSNDTFGDTGVSGDAGNGWWAELIEKVVGYGITWIIILISLAFLFWGLWKLISWLLKSSSLEEKNANSMWKEFISWLKSWRSRLVMFFYFIKGVFAPGPTRQSARFYLRLLSWGRRCGLPRFHFETPVEYGQMLIRQFPGERYNIELIIESFNREAYGNKKIGKEQLQRLKTAWRKMRSPLKWPQRFKSWFYQGRKYRET